MRLRLLLALTVFTLFAAPASAHFGEGQIYVIDFQNSKVYFVDPANNWFFAEINPATAQSNNPGAIGFNHHGDMIIANYGDDTIKTFDGTGLFSTVLTAADGINGPWGPSGMVIGPGHGDVFITNIDSDQILTFDEEFLGGSVFADAADGLSNPAAVAFLADGHMLVTDRGASNQIYHFDSVTGQSTAFDTLPDTAVDLIIRNNGDVYVLTTRGDIFRYIGGNSGNRVLLGNYGGSSINGGLDFTPDHTAIYHVCTADASIREIDPDTGSAVVQLVLPGSPISLAVVGSQFAPGTFIEFGEPLAGTGAVEPTLLGLGEPRIGQVSQVDAHSFVGGSTVFLFVSLEMDESVLKGGEFHIGGLGTPSATFLALPAGGLAGAPGAGGLDLPFIVPNNPSLVGTKWYMQALGTDAGAPFGVSFSPCLTMYIGS